MMVYLHQLCLVGNFTQSTQEQITGTLNGFNGHLYLPSREFLFMYLPYWIWFVIT